MDGTRRLHHSALDLVEPRGAQRLRGSFHRYRPRDLRTPGSLERRNPVNPATLAQLYRKELELSKVKKGETLCVVSDLATRREYIQAAFAAADELGADIYELCVNS